MKKIEALISPESLAQVREMLESRHVSNFMFSNVIARGTNGVHQHVYRGHSYAVEFEAGVKVEAVVQDDEATDTAYAILRAAGRPRVSCKPRVLLAPVSQAILQLNEVGVDSAPPSNGVEQPIQAPASASEPIAIPVDGARAWSPVFSALAKIRRFLAALACAERVAEPLTVGVHRCC